jgi:PTH1 family peptidyl-tRNA hydrolase
VAIPSAIFFGVCIMEDRVLIKAVVGLGNPGAQYGHNRHNIGFQVLDLLANRYGVEWHDKEKLEYADIHIADRPIVLIKPQTFMNSSGEIMPFLRKKGIDPESILVVHDELEKPFGKLAIRLGGSHRGHNGLRSLIGFCGGDFWRLRFGVGRPDDKAHVSQYVLSNFTESQEEINQLIDQAIEMIEKKISETL